MFSEDRFELFHRKSYIPSLTCYVSKVLVHFRTNRILLIKLSLEAFEELIVVRGLAIDLRWFVWLVDELSDVFIVPPSPFSRLLSFFPLNKIKSRFKFK